VKGHSGVPGNERVDALANAAIDALQGARVLG
jgi:ribonuclease HI